MKTKMLQAATVSFCLLANLAGAQLTVGTYFSGGLNEPYGIAVDSDFNIYVTDSGHNQIVKIDGQTQVGTTLAGSGLAGADDGLFYAASFNNPQGLLAVTISNTPGLLVADYGNNLIRFVRLSDGYVTTIAGNVAGGTAINATGTNATFKFPLGMDQDANGNVYIADWGNNAVRVMNLNDPAFGVTNLTVSGGSIHYPTAIAFAGSNTLWVADDTIPGKPTDSTIKLFTLTNVTTGSLTAFVGGNSIYTNSGYVDSPVGANARFKGPRGLLWDSSVGLLVADTGNKVIRVVTNSPVYGANNYSVQTLAGNGVAGAQFSSPFGIVKDVPNGRFLLTDAGANNSIRSIQYGPVLGPCPTPTIGYILFTNDLTLGFYSRLVTTPPFTFNNDVDFGIAFENGYQCAYTIDGSQPTKSSPTPPHYRDIFTAGEVDTIRLQGITPQSNIVIRSFCYSPGQQNSATTNAYIHFITANPIFMSQNAANFDLFCLTTNSVIYYTTDGSDPRGITNAAVVAADPSTLKANFQFITNNFLFKCFARRGIYQDSGVVSNYFSAANFVPNKITFGLTNGEPSSHFVARPGQYFYSPVTLQLLPGFNQMYSLQFNVAVTNGYTNLFNGAAVPHVVNGAGIDFFSMLMTSVQPDEGTYYPPADGNWYLTIPPVTIASAQGTTNYANTLFVNTNNNLLGVGYFYRTGFKYKFADTNGYVFLDFDTTKQDLITYSIAHDTLFSKSKGVVVVGAYAFQVPNNATNGDQYFIQLGSPSATADGVGAPGSGIYIQPPPLSQAVTVGSPVYLVGDAAPFRWLNAGDFGNTNLDSADVMQVYQSAIANVDMPPANSDLYYAMDSCGNVGVTNTGSGYYTNTTAFPYPYAYTVTNTTYTFDTNGALVNTTQDVINLTTFVYNTTASITATYTDYEIFLLVPPASPITNIFTKSYTINVTPPPVVSDFFNGSDSYINQIAFGDGVLDVNDLFVTFRRSLDPSLIWFKRFWTNNQFVAVPTPSLAFNTNTPHKAAASLGKAGSTPAVSGGATPDYTKSTITFSAGDAVVTASQTIQIPIKAHIFGDYPLRVLGLSLTVVPLDGSPALTTPVNFAPVAALGAPTISSAKGASDSSAAWLNSGIAGLTGDVIIGTLTLTVPANANSQSAYAVHFGHASGSPNGLAIFPKQAVNGLITLSSRTNLFGGIPDSWRLRWFGTADTNNLLSIPDNCPSHDGISNYKKYVAGVDPLTPNNFPSVNVKTPAPAGSTAIHWPSVSGKQYVIERSSSLFPGTWTTIATNTGTGGDMEFDDPASGAVKFYRVRILP